MSQILRVVLFASIVALAPMAAGARATFHDLDIKQAMDSDVGKSKLLGVPVHFAGQSYAKVASDMGVFTANRRTNAFNKSDEQACRIAFLSAVIALQSRAQKLDADAVVDIKSITKHRKLESAKQYRCAAGNVVANVVLTGRVVKFKK
jgi:uncharacterized protein YbjQ (UPF0145 family)